MPQKNNYQLITEKLLFIIMLPIFLQFSCGQASNKKPSADTAKFETATLTVEIAKKHCLAILLAKDGTINRKGSGVVDTADKAFFMGITRDGVFDSLMGTVSDDLLAYSGKTDFNCDTTRQTYIVRITFADHTSAFGITYCVNGTIDDLPKPIREYITNAIKLTEPWYQAQKKQVSKN